MKITQLILKGDPQGAAFIKRLVDEIVKDLKQREAEDILGGDDDDDINLDDIDLKDLY